HRPVTVAVAGGILQVVVAGLGPQGEAAVAQRPLGAREVVPALGAQVEDVRRIGHAYVVVPGKAEGRLDLGVVDVVIGTVVAGVGHAREAYVALGAGAQLAGPADEGADFVVDAVHAVAEVDVRGEGAHVETALVLHHGFDLQRRILLGLGHAAPDVVAGRDHLAAERPGGLGLLRMGGQGGRQQGGERGAEREPGHDFSPCPDPGEARHDTPPRPAGKFALTPPGRAPNMPALPLFRRIAVSLRLAPLACALFLVACGGNQPDPAAANGPAGAEEKVL